jgi:hypothetical protein
VSFFRRLTMPPVPPLSGKDPSRQAWAIEDYLRKVRDALSAWNPDVSPIIVGEETVDGATTLTDSDTIESTQDGDNVSLAIVEDSVTDSLLFPMTANSIKGNATAATANPADIVIGLNTVLGRVAGNIVAAQLATGQVAAAAITYSKIQAVAASRILLRGSAGGAGDVEEGTAALGLSIVGTALTPVPVVLSPAQLLAATNDWAPGTLGPDRTTIYVTSDASRDVTGILATGIADGVTLMLINRGAQDVVLKHANGGSVAANQFLCPGAADVTLNANEAALIVRDATSTLWRVYAF